MERTGISFNDALARSSHHDHDHVQVGSESELQTLEVLIDLISRGQLVQNFVKSNFVREN